MAQLTFDGIQPVRFGTKECTPSINAEKRLRVQNIKFDTETDTQKANEVLASCFPDDEKYVADFLETQMSPFEKQQLRAYLVAGPGGIRIIDETIASTLNKAAEEANNE